MRTAEEYVNEGFKDWVIAGQIKEHCRLLINQARKETLIEAAERAKSDWIRHGELMGHAVNMQSILALIKELK